MFDLPAFIQLSNPLLRFLKAFHGFDKYSRVVALFFKNLVAAIGIHKCCGVLNSFPSVQSNYRLRFATFDAFLPSAVRVAFGKWAMVRLRLAAAAAFLMFLLAADRCFSVAIAPSIVRANCSTT
jgi:hypothetical protein